MRIIKPHADILLAASTARTHWTTRTKSADQPTEVASGVNTEGPVIRSRGQTPPRGTEPTHDVAAAAAAREGQLTDST